MPSPLSILQQYWNYQAFRSQQEEIIQSVLNKKDTIALLPTGGGKSICYQIPALLNEGLCLVISPLIALMKDQVANLEKKNIPAVALHSGLNFFEVKQALQNAVNNNYKMLYVSPERLQSRLFKEYLSALNVNLIAVDEAHCISQWGYDFRPSYSQIAILRDFINAPLLALTASATPIVLDDIKDKFAAVRRRAIRRGRSRRRPGRRTRRPRRTGRRARRRATGRGPTGKSEQGSRAGRRRPAARASAAIINPPTIGPVVETTPPSSRKAIVGTVIAMPTSQVPTGRRSARRPARRARP